MLKVKDIASAIEFFAPKTLQESYDNAGLQVGNPEMKVSGVLLCLDVTEGILEEAKSRGFNLIVSHHPLIFKGLKGLTGQTPAERIVIDAVRNDIAVYSAHTNLDSAWEGVSHEMAHILGLCDIRVLEPKPGDAKTGLGVIGTSKPTPTLEYIRKVKEAFNVKCLRYSSQSPKLVVRRVAVVGGSGASLIADAVSSGADLVVTGDVKYHDFTSYAHEIVIADIGHYESELCSINLLSRIIRDKYPECTVCPARSESNPITYM